MIFSSNLDLYGLIQTEKHFLTMVPAKVSSKLEGACVLKPPDSLMAITSLSTGQALVQNDLTNIPVANLSLKLGCLEKCVTLGTLTEFQEQENTE
ncbi:hypothetical protein OUZ56_032784 [Daphnia magna]|uniref:Uncharacterized protein n=1 Tax=Daphnia magna TaxID=35525 RepID=A0ABQ9ZX39_9CRUS|nr:hypothetical protein OUZ56_032784 [Daphnia magna]